MRRVTSAVYVILAVFIAPSLCRAQQMPEVSPLDGYTAGQVMQGAPAGSRALSAFETLNSANGQLSINIPLVTVKGRGSVSVPLAASLTTPIWDVTGYSSPYGCGQYNCQGIEWTYAMTSSGWIGSGNYGAGQMAFRSAGDYCVPVINSNQSRWNTVLTRGSFYAPDGTETEFVDQNTNGTPEAGNTGYNRGTVFIADNGSFAKFTASAPVTDPTFCGAAATYASGTLVFRDGTKYAITDGAVTLIEDRNGNYTWLGNPITDSLGRTYQITNDGTYDQIQYPGAGGAVRTITVHYSALGSVLAPGESLETYSQLWAFSTPLGNGSQQYDPNGLVSEIDLPDGSKYLFTYHAYGDVAQITLPTGGVIQYDYNAVIAFTTTSPGSIDLLINGQPVPTAVPPAYMYALSRSLKERRQYLSGTLVAKTDYSSSETDSYDGSGNLLSKQTYTIPNGGTLPNSGTNYNAAQYNQQTQTNYYDAGGTTLLESQTVAWTEQNCQVNCSTKQTVTTTMNGMVNQTTYAYDQYNNVSDEYDYDWKSGVPGALLRHTFQAYQVGSTYLSENLLNLFFYAKVYDGSGNEVANWDQEDDETSLGNNPSMIWYDVGYNGITARGNPTTKRVWLKSTGIFLASHYTYDIAGNVTSVTDANGHAASFSYSDNYSDGENRNSYALVTAVTNALNQQTTIQNDYGTGKPVLTVDANGSRTSYAYSDPLDRLTQATLPTGATTTYSYPSTTEVDAYQDQSTPGDHALRTRTYSDGFGRTSETDTFESSSQYIATTQGYDALGRVAKTTNPSRPGDGLGFATTYAYDGLGRQTKVTTADQAQVNTSYSGSQLTITDQASRQRWMAKDGLGRLSWVNEDPGSSPHLNYTTTYSYDALGDLTGVSQPGQTRSFGYDSLGR